MDPDEALRLLRQGIAQREQADSLAAENVAAEQIASAAVALDGWLSHGGFLPAAWSSAVRP